MSTYAIGDIQGCYDPFRRLLDKIRFDPANDTLWVAGDLVNRGPQSLATVELLRSLGSQARCILGNHDLHLLAVAYGARKPSRKDTMDEVIDSPAFPDIIDWLRHLPLMIHDPELDFTMVHAGLVPQWSTATALDLAAELETALRRKDPSEFFAHMYGDAPARWHDNLRGWDRLRFITNVFTRLRFCTPHGDLDLTESGPPGSQSSGLVPWYAVPGRASSGERIVFGHWAALDITPKEAKAHRAFHIDTGCVWGGRLTALDLERLRYTRVAA